MAASALRAARRGASLTQRLLAFSRRQPLDVEVIDAGDLVQFEVSMERRMRLAHNAELVQQNACTGLPDRLKEGAGQSSEAPSGGAKIVPITEALNRRPARELARREA